MSQREPGNLRFGPRPVPDYSQRSTRLRLFLMVAACMFVLALAERSRDPKNWQWLWDLDKLAQRREPLNNRLHEEPATTTEGEALVTMQGPPPLAPAAPQIDPVARAWQQGWKDVYERLEPGERALLFELLYGASRRQALAADKATAAADLLARATTLWEDYQAVAFQAVSELKGDDQTQWVDVLRQVNGRFSDDVRPAVQAAIDGRTPTESEERALTGLSQTLLELTTAQIQDDTVFRPAEREIWFHTLAEVRDQTAAELARRSLGQVAYLQLYKQPREYRRQVVSLKGTVRWAYRRQAPDNYLGIKEYYIYWLHPDGGPTSPIVVYALAAPPGFPALKDKDVDGSMSDLHEAVEVTGVFYKRWAYPGQDGTYSAPLVVAHTPVWRRSDLDLTAGRTGLSPVELGAAIIAALLMAACVTVVLWRRTQRRRPPDEFGPPNISSLSNLTLAPTPRDALRQLEQEARQGEV